MGSVLGGVLSLTNLYIGLKAGWGFGVAITACILSYAIWTTLYTRRPRAHADDHPREQLHAVDGQLGGLLDRRHADLGLRGLHAAQQPAPCRCPACSAWVFFLAVLGVTMAIPMKRQMINIEQLRFPSGIAAAETLRALHCDAAKGHAVGQGPRAGPACWRSLSKFWTDGLTAHQRQARPVPDRRRWSTPLQPARVRPGLDGPDGDVRPGSPIFIAAGAITGHARVLRACCSAASLCWMIFVPRPPAPAASSRARASRPSCSGRSGAASACMVTSGLLSFALQWRSALRAFSGLGRMFCSGRTGTHDPDGTRSRRRPLVRRRPARRLVALAWLAHATFDMPYWQTVDRGAAVLRAGAGRLPRDGRDRHHAGRARWARSRSSPSGPPPGQHERQPDERQHHRRRREHRPPTC